MAICKETVIAAMPGDGSTGAEGLAFPHKLVTAWPQCGPSGTVIVPGLRCIRLKKSEYLSHT